MMAESIEMVQYLKFFEESIIEWGVIEGPMASLCI